MNFLVILPLVFFTSCSSSSRKGSWGKKAIFPIKAERIKEAFKKTSRSPHFWAPIGLASVIHILYVDKKISTWATTNHPVYGSDKNAANFSKGFHEVLKYEAYGTILLTPPFDVWYKTKGAIVVYTAYSEARAFNNTIRKFTFRQRPNKVDDESLPSGHATTASAGRALSEKNLDYVDMDSRLRSAMSVVNTSMAIGTGWERVEGNSHYPTDVLIGYSFGYFMSAFIYEALMNLDSDETFAVFPTGGKWIASYQLSF